MEKSTSEKVKDVIFWLYAGMRIDKELVIDIWNNQKDLTNQEKEYLSKYWSKIIVSAYELNEKLENASKCVAQGKLPNKGDLKYLLHYKTSLDSKSLNQLEQTIIPKIKLINEQILNICIDIRKDIIFNNVLPNAQDWEKVKNSFDYLSEDLQEEYESWNEIINNLVNELNIKFNNVKNEVYKGKAPDKDIYEELIRNKEFLNMDDRIQLENLSQQAKALIVRKENPFRNLPGIKQIYDFIEKRKKKSNDIVKAEKQTNNEENSFKRQYSQEEFKSNSQDDKETIVVSDLHGDKGKWDILRNMLKSNPTTNLIILGDAMDRGAYGPEILMEIKEYSDKGRVVYLPGNHDEFAYNYMEHKKQNDQIYSEAYKNLKYNGGKETIRKLDNFDYIVQQQLANGRIEKRITLQELTDWLGSQPIQAITCENKQRYLLAHAMFDKELYCTNSVFCLKDALRLKEKTNRTPNEENIFKKFQNVMWYRREKQNDDSLENSVPIGAKLIIGHTATKSGEVEKRTSNNDKSIIYCVDTHNKGLRGFNLTASKELSAEDIAIREYHGSNGKFR